MTGEPCKRAGSNTSPPASTGLVQQVRQLEQSCAESAWRARSARWRVTFALNGVASNCCTIVFITIHNSFRRPRARWSDAETSSGTACLATSRLLSARRIQRRAVSFLSSPPPGQLSFFAQAAPRRIAGLSVWCACFFLRALIFVAEPALFRTQGYERQVHPLLHLLMTAAAPRPVRVRFYYRVSSTTRFCPARRSAGRP